MDREGLIFMAKLAENAERYDDMVDLVRRIVADTSAQLTDEERTLLSVAFKNVVGMRRASWRMLSAIECNTVTANTVAHVSLVQQQRSKVEGELTVLCTEALTLVDALLERGELTSAEDRVFYHKMKGDYARYLAEYQSASDETSATNITKMTTMKDSATATARSAYEAAEAVALAELPPTHPVRLGLALNFAVFCYDIDKSPQKACTLAKQAFDDAIAELDTLSDESYRDSTLIMQLLRDNLTLWTAEEEDDEDLPHHANH